MSSTRPSHVQPARNRHGRGVRGPILPVGVPRYRTRADSFDQLVIDAYAPLHNQYFDELAGVDLAVDTIIHNLITSRAVPELIEEHGGKAVRTRVGHSYIKAQMAEHAALFGGEHSAHYYFSEFFNADSGLVAALHVLAALAEQDAPLSEMMGAYERYTASGEINSEVADQAAATQRVVDAFADRAESVDTLDGVTVQLKGSKAWFNVRASNTEPLLRLNAEAPTRDEVDALTEEILGIIRA